MLVVFHFYCKNIHVELLFPTDISMIAGEDLIHDLLIVSEKAASVARICRQNDHLLSLLIQEKSATEKNARFLTDFKTLADVLVQEMIKYELETKVSIVLWLFLNPYIETGQSIYKSC